MLRDGLEQDLNIANPAVKTNYTEKFKEVINQLKEANMTYVDIDTDVTMWTNLY
jgi:hypothetical protein